MNNESIDKWHILLSKVELLRSSISQVESVSTINSEDDDLVICEARLRARFTEDYKTFCKTFGQGCFGVNWIFILAPNKSTMDIQIADQEDILYSFEGQLHYKNNAEFAPILNESYVFGISQDVIFIFVKDALEEQNLNSHIYAVDKGGDVYDFGEDFFGFVKNFCLNKGIERQFPKLLDYMVPIDRTIDQLVAPTFTPLE